MEREWAASVEELKGELRMERERGTELQAQVGEALQREKANADLLERMMRELKQERERRTELEERVKVLIAPDTDSERCEANEKDGTESQSDTGRDKKGHPEASVEKGCAGDSTTAPRSYGEVARQSSGGVVHGVSTGGSVPRVRDAQRMGTQQARTGGQQPQVGSERLWRRRVLVVGDSNVARVEEGVLARVKADRRVRVETQSGKCMVDALTKAREVVGDRMEGENLVIIHAGLNDVLKGRSQNIQSQLEVGVGKLREASESVQITICTIPEVQGQSSGMERRVVEANRVIRGMSRQLGYSIMEVNRDVNELGFRPFACDGIHYSRATGRRVGNRMGCQATAFLGGHRALRPPV